MPLYPDKFKQMILFFIERSIEERGSGPGLVKLSELLYRADFEAFRQVGSVMAGESYERQAYGPSSRSLPLVLDELATEGHLELDSLQAAGIHRDPHRKTPPKADRRVFNSKELRIMEEVVKELTDPTLAARYKATAGWGAASEDGVMIEYSSALIDPSPMPPEDLERASRLVVERGWAKAS